MSLRFKLITAPTEEPVNLTDAKLHLRVDGDDDDRLISTLITAARDTVELISRRLLVTQTWELVLDAWPASDRIMIPRPPLVSITSIKYKDEDGTESTFASANYIVDVDNDPGQVVLAEGVSWPDGTLYPVSAIRVRFVAGYGDANDVPERYKQAIKLLVGHWYENREESVVTGAVPQSIQFGVEALLRMDRVLTY